MKKYVSFLICLLFLLIVSPAAQSQDPYDDQSQKSRTNPQVSQPASKKHNFKRNVHPRRPGIVIYKVKPFVFPAQKNKLKNVLIKHSARTINLHPKLNLSFIRFPETPKSEEELCAELLATGVLQFCEPDYLIPPALIPNDEYYASQWAHTKINSPAAWDITTGISEIIAAVCDTGVNAEHPDLQTNVMLPGYNSADDSDNTEDSYGHGTMVAGCIAAVGNNTIGVTGLCWQIRLLPVRITNRDDGYAYISDIARGIQWAADQGARVINVSYGVGSSYTIDTVAQYARDLKATTVISAGNNGKNIDDWRDSSSFLLIGATDSDDNRALFSNYGIPIDVMAPGMVYTTRSSDTYGGAAGTSFSAPITAGLVALIYSLDISFTPDEVEQFIFSTAKDLGDSSRYGYGRIDAAAAVQKANSTPSPSPVFSPTVTPSPSPVFSPTVTP
ncbi:S8 family serine peptidase, partial [bacterium]|nr:S8 family serine peptidase [bacterium]